jgi:hypothetical protein
MKRREVLSGAASLLAAGAVWAAVRKVAPAALLPGETPAARAFVERLCDIVIPDTDTPGARRAGVPAFLFLALAHGLESSSSADLDQLLKDIRAGAGREAHQLDAQHLHDAVAAIDAKAFESRGSYWSRLKKVIIIGYYTSEIGGSQELRYELAPGRYEPDLPVTADTRALSNDWVGLHF